MYSLSCTKFWIPETVNNPEYVKRLHTEKLTQRNNSIAHIHSPSTKF